MKSSTLVVMAAGIGKRYGGFKQLDPVGPNGEIILDYSIYDALKVGFQKIIFVINKGIEADFKSRIKNRIGNICEISYVNQEISNIPPGFDVPPERTKPWGTAHALYCCKEKISGSIGVINADDFYGSNSFRLLYDQLNLINQKSNNLYEFCLVGYRLEKTLSDHGYVARGVCRVDRKGYLAEVVERTHIERIGDGIYYSEDVGNRIKIKSNSVVSMNMWGFTDHIFKELERSFKRFYSDNITRLSEAEYFLPDVVNHLLIEKKARVKVLRSADRWFGITYPADKLVVQQAIHNLIGRGFYPENLWEQYDPR